VEKNLVRLFETLLIEAQTDYPECEFTRCVRIAAEAAIEALAQRVNSYAEQRIAGHQELINRLHFECRS